MISAPEDYGLSEQETLEFTYEREAPGEFDVYWAQWREEVQTLSTHMLEPPVGTSSTVKFRSLNEVRIVGRLTVPDGPVRGAVVATHGYEAPGEIPGEDEPWTAYGLATLRLRVRGYPPSTLDIDDLRGQWVLHNIYSPQSWVLRGAAADVVQGYRVLRRRLGDEMPIALHGESFGGGLAVLAAAQLTELGDPPSRIVMALPTFGAWQWRIGRYVNGSGGQVNMVADVLRDEDRASLLRLLDCFDAALHARRVWCPALCKLATRDDVVPAPSAAAVYNALSTHAKWRFVTRYGHYDGGLADVRRHGLFERLHPRFVNPTVEPQSAINDTSMAMELAPGPVN